MAILGLNARPFSESLKKARLEAAANGKAMAKDLTVTPGGGPSPGGGHGGVKSGAMRETLVLMREIGRGNWSRVPGSFSLLVQQLGLLKYLFNPITIGVAVLGAGIYAAYKWSEKLTGQLSDLKFPDLHPEYIAKHLQAVNQAAEAQKAINREVQKTVDLYESASKAAERLTEHTREEFEHQRKMNKAAEQKELNEATSERQRQSIRAKYAAKGLDINAAEREEQRKNKLAESDALLGESKQKQGEGDAIKVSSKEADDQLLKQKQEAAKQAQKFLDEEIPKKAAKEAARRQEKEQTGWVLKAPGTAAADKKQEENIAEARRRVQDAKDFEDKKATYDELRKKKDDLYRQAGGSKAKSAVAFLEAKQIGKDNERKNKDEKAESDADLAAERAKHLRGGHRADVNSLQRIGAYTAGRDNLNSSVRSIERNVAKIADNHAQHGGHSGNHHGHGHVPGFGHH